MGDRLLIDLVKLEGLVSGDCVYSGILYRAEQLEIYAQAVSDIRRVLSKPECTWQEFWSVAHADPYRTLYLERGEVVEEIGDKVVVAWQH
ncbi:hypothetical protein WKK05_15255 [Nostoc sp. UHCC 0302]|uniref:hypothetical protein n=1 Tax=Nostoc sp. UHCC 0302 TaxID=3134896 RepID=UPI00311CD67B